MITLLTHLAFTFGLRFQVNVPKGPEAMTYRSVEGKELKAYVFNPVQSGPGRPAILLFHGGAWTLGDASWNFDRAKDFANRGMVAIAIEYRLAQPGNGSKGLSPIDSVGDALAAFKWAREQYKALGIDPKRVAGYGVSAGGHLVAAAALLPAFRGEKIKPAARPNVVMLYCAALNMAKDEYFDRLMAGHGDPSLYSPSEYIANNLPPTFMVDGDQDSIVLPKDAIGFRDAALKFGGKCVLVMYPGVGHMLTRNLKAQYRDFNPDPADCADANDKENEFLRTLGFEGPYLPRW